MTDFAKSLSSIPRLSAKTNKKYIKICDDADFYDNFVYINKKWDTLESY